MSTYNNFDHNHHHPSDDVHLDHFESPVLINSSSDDSRIMEAESEQSQNGSPEIWHGSAQVSTMHLETNDDSPPRFSREDSLGHFMEQLNHRYPPDNENNCRVELENSEAVRRVMEKHKNVYAKKLAIVQKLKAEDEEVKAAQERIEANEKKTKQLEAQYVLMVQKHEEDVRKTDLKLEKAKEGLQNAKMEYGRVKNIEAEHSMKYRRQEKRAKDARNLRAQLEKWLDNHGIAFHMAPLTGDDSGTQQADELLIYITKLDPNSPTRDFIISLDYLSVEHTKFKVRSLTPVFDEAYDLIQKANTEQDLPKFMVECKRYWLRDCTDNSSGLPPERTTGDHTEPLFDSPSSTLSENAD